MSSYQTLTALVANVIYVCVLYKLLHGFLVSKRPFWQECCLYSAAYVVLTAVYLLWDIPLLTMLSNIVVLLALSCCYPASWRRRLLVVAFAYGIAFLCETLVVTAAEARGFAHFTDFSNKEYLIVQIISKLFIYVIALWITRLGKLKTETALPSAYWLALLAIPTLTLLPTYVLLMTVDKAWDMGVAVSVLMLFVLNGLVLYLYEQIIQLYQDKLAQGAEREQTRMVSRQLEAEQEAMGKMRHLRHEWNNLLLPVLAEMEIGDYESAEAGLRQLITDIGSSGSLVQDGDPVLAAVINYKLTDVQALGVTVRCQVDVPDDLKEHINVQMVSILLGNLLDNAVRAVHEDERAADEKYIDLKLSVRLGTLLIIVVNSFNGYLRMEHGQYQTTKADQQNHGLGLATIRQIVENQQGDLAIETNNAEFKVRIKLFLNSPEK